MRDDLIRAALADTTWAKWSQTPIAGDASARRYFRLETSGEQPVILMDDASNGTNATTRFAGIAHTLTNHNLAAPRIMFHDAGLGLMIIEDLGHIDFATHLHDFPLDEESLYSAATKVLGRIHHEKFTLPLTTISPSVAAEMINLAALHYAPTPDATDALYGAVLTAYAAYVDPTPHLALRDFHAENLIWRPEQNGLLKVGLLDFQDACFAPAGYDLMSLLRDARREVDPRVSDSMITQFCGHIGATPDNMSAHLACVAAQRNLRILGIFARLSRQDAKTKYLALLPRVWRHLMADLTHPAMNALKKVVIRALPAPDTETLNRLSRP